MTVIMRFLTDLFPSCELSVVRWPGGAAYQAMKEPAAEVNLVQVEQFGVALGPPA